MPDPSDYRDLEARRRMHDSAQEALDEFAAHEELESEVVTFRPPEPDWGEVEAVVVAMPELEPVPFEFTFGPDGETTIEDCVFQALATAAVVGDDAPRIAGIAQALVAAIAALCDTVRGQDAAPRSN